jgi:hypothetical protein
MHGPNQQVPKPYIGIARAELDGSLHERDHLLYRPGIEVAPGETTQCRHQIAIQRERCLIFGDGLLPSVLRPQIRRGAGTDLSRGCYDAVAIARAVGFRMLVMSRIRHAAIVP